MFLHCFRPPRQEDAYSQSPSNDFFHVCFAHHDAKNGRFMDSFCAKFPFVSHNSGYFALFEGYNSRDAANEATLHLHRLLESEIKLNALAEDFRRCFEKAYSKMDTHLQHSAFNYGTSAATCVIRKIDASSRHQVQLANVGNVRAILSRKFKAIRISKDHTAAEAKEACRLEKCQAPVQDGLVNGETRVSRALGGHALKQWVIGSPHYVEFDLMGDDDAIIMLGERSWKFLKSDQEAVNMLRGGRWASALPSRRTFSLVTFGLLDLCPDIPVVGQQELARPRRPPTASWPRRSAAAAATPRSSSCVCNGPPPRPSRALPAAS